MSVRKALKSSERVWAPFSGRKGLPYAPQSPRTWGSKRESFYCHGYRQPGEHYHPSFEELLDCDLMGDEPHLRELRAARRVTLAKREEAPSK